MKKLVNIKIAQKTVFLLLFLGAVYFGAGLIITHCDAALQDARNQYYNAEKASEKVLAVNIEIDTANSLWSCRFSKMLTPVPQEDKIMMEKLRKLRENLKSIEIK